MCLYIYIYLIRKHEMATAEMNTDGDQTLSPSEEDSPPVLDDTSVPLNFSELTPSQFGISVQSFTPASLSNSKDKSRLAQLKVRRRSSVGVRGSPETNSLIRFMAQQRMKTPPTFQTPELVRSSPFLPRVASTLRQKMASFQSLMDVEESEVCDPMPRQDSNTGGCIKTRDYLSDRNRPYGGKENHPPMMTPIPSKRRRMGPVEGSEVEIKEASAPILHLSLKKQEDDVFELQSLGRPPPDDSAAASPPRPAPPFHIPSLPSLLEMKPTGLTVFAGEDDSTGTSTVKNNKKKKRVCFGGPLSPELFDKNLPPSTPLQKGGTPARAPTPGGSLQPRSLLKTPQRSESQTAPAQPDLSSPTVFGASPILAMPRNRRMPSEGEDEEGSIVFPSMEEIDSPGTRNTECLWEAQPLNLNAAFYEESLSQILTESETTALDEPTASPEKEKQHDVEAPAPCRDRRKKQPGPEHAPSSEAPARSSSRKRKQPEESQPVKRSTRSAAKTASGKMKRSSAARQWNRGVDRSLYGCRAYASKNPGLSPITERLAPIGQSAAKQTSCTSCTAPNHETHSNPEMANNTQATGDLTVTNALENPVTSPNSSKRNSTAKGRRLPGPRGLKKRRKVSAANDALLSEETPDQAGGTTEDQTTTNLEASSETPLNRTVPEQGEVDTEHNAQIPADTLCTDSDGKLECRGSPEAPTSDCPPTGGESNKTLSRSAQRKRDNVSVLQQNKEEEEKEEGDHAAIEQENIRSSSDSQEEVEVADLHLAPWQADFNFEDVFKPVPARRQRSVRRSLRNQSTAEHSSNRAGLAWLAWTSPESSKESRRKTRARRLSAAPPVQPSPPEETQDNAS
ncbi:cell division cycle-associated protein 2 isoform X2 [Anarrhichthys ocellatus]|uniref:cell division cycle-associated protein 2 isoform X2 n=1 Tax=Anarrhichthys ocellatus TaxID=433405 RepID=UPI0012ED4644|nr:cell division cycle-associated protein 2 isoform X2 [Anarrhichthys ocellatus]